MVRDISDRGARIQLGRLTIPRRFDLTFDNFSTVQPCRVIWRDDQYVGAVFDDAGSGK